MCSIPTIRGTCSAPCVRSVSSAPKKARQRTRSRCRRAFPLRHAELFLGNAGTAFSPLDRGARVVGGDYRLSGVPRMHERPIGDLVDALRLIGAQMITWQRGLSAAAHRETRLDLSRPVRIRGNTSSQFLTGLLMALPLSRRGCTIEIEGGSLEAVR